jgi:hypothetical protein
MKAFAYIIGATVILIIVAAVWSARLSATLASDGFNTTSAPNVESAELLPTATATAITSAPVAVEPTPTARLASTSAPIAPAPAFEEIRSIMGQMTDAQWNQYSISLEGLTATEWVGWVEDVNEKTFGGYELWVDMDPPEETFSVQDVTFDIPEDIALEIRRDSKVTFSGRIISVMNIMGSLQILLKDASIVPPKPLVVNAESMEYVNKIDGHMNRFMTNLDIISGLLNEPRTGDADWNDKALAVTSEIESLYNELITLNPPEQIAEFHQGFMEAIDICRSLALALSPSYGPPSESAITIAQQTSLLCSQLVLESMELLPPIAHP